ncbi:MAG: signal peptidase II [Oscillospiraceae bacterium]|nr:signal peptidase II [Oscillospiraceae bacterium]
MLYASVAALIVVIDQYVKYWVSNNIGLGGEDVRTIIPGILGLVNIRNDGAAFGFLSGGRIWFILIAGVLLVAAIILLATKAIKNPAARWALVMITAGGVGNAIDRVINGYVQDMFKTLFTDFAIFNVADIFITVGGILFIICIIFGRDPNKEERSVRRSRRLRDEEEEEDEEDEDEEEEEPRRPSRSERRAARKAAREAEEEDDDEDEDEDEEEEEKPRKRSILKKSRRNDEEEEDDEDEDEEEEEELLRKKRRAERDAKIEKLKAERLRRQREAEEEDDEEELELPRRRKVSSAEAAPAKKAPRKDAFTEYEERSKAAGSYTRYGKGVEVRSSGIKDVDVSDKFRNLREPSPEKAAPAKTAPAAERKPAPASDKAAVQAAAAAALAANAKKSAPKAAEKPPVKSSDDEFDLDSILAEFK